MFTRKSTLSDYNIQKESTLHLVISNKKESTLSDYNIQRDTLYLVPHTTHFDIRLIRALFTWSPAIRRRAPFQTTTMRVLFTWLLMQLIQLTLRLKHSGSTLSDYNIQKESTPHLVISNKNESTLSDYNIQRDTLHLVPHTTHFDIRLISWRTFFTWSPVIIRRALLQTTNSEREHSSWSSAIRRRASFQTTTGRKRALSTWSSAIRRRASFQTTTFKMRVFFTWLLMQLIQLTLRLEHSESTLSEYNIQKDSTLYLIPHATHFNIRIFREHSSFGHQ